ncbi:MAG: hypothetical protein ABSG79_26695 [Bryobacteraceae bacterium]|jgi:hypothetical protein
MAVAHKICKTVAVILCFAVLLLMGCTRSTTVNMDVVTEQGFLGTGSYGRTLGDLRPGTWDFGEIQICRKVQLKVLDDRSDVQDLLICGTDTHMVWVLLAEDEKKGGQAAAIAKQMEAHIALDAKTFSVAFHGSRPPWHCRKAMDGIICE